jgi:hypothetical protein
MSWMVWMPMTSRVLSVNAEMATGTSCRFCSRFSAVTTSSSMVLVDAARVWAWASVAAPRAAASKALVAMRWRLYRMSLPPRSSMASIVLWGEADTAELSRQCCQKTSVSLEPSPRRR